MSRTTGWHHWQPRHGARPISRSNPRREAGRFTEPANFLVRADSGQHSTPREVPKSWNAGEVERVIGRGYREDGAGLIKSGTAGKEQPLDRRGAGSPAREVNVGHWRIASQLRVPSPTQMVRIF